MLIIFKSAASGDVITLERNGKEMLTVLGRDREAHQGALNPPVFWSSTFASA